MPADMDALNYPYIRVRSADWLKRTLLIFPHVARMTPFDNAPTDDPDVQPFCWHMGSRGPLLRPADLWSRHVEDAQRDLIRALDKLFERRGRGFLNSLRRDGDHRYGDPRYEPLASQHLDLWDRRLMPGGPFQIHGQKVLGDLVEYLRRKDLVWQPEQAYWHGPEYLEMAPRLGEAIMATLAVACAENEGLQVVTEFPAIHGKLLATPREAILDAAFASEKTTRRTSGQQIAEFLVYRRCDVTNLTAERIGALKSERDALADFRSKLEDLAATLPPTIYSERTLEERLNDTLNEMFQDWKRDQANLSTYARQVFGDGVLAEPGKLAQKLVEDAAKPEAAVATSGAAGAAGVAGYHLGGLTLGAASGAAAGFVVALVFRAVAGWGGTKKAAAASPYRYLTTLQNHGVSFSLVK